MTTLNKQQYLASLPNKGVSLVIAGAGTGKTKTLIEKVKNIILEGVVKPENILILTFSRKAANEIKERVKSGIGSDADKVTSGTFHSFCLSFLRKNSKVFQFSFGFSQFPKIIDEDEAEKIKTRLLRDSIDNFYGLPVKVISGLLDSTDNLDKKIFKKLKRLGIISEIQNIKQKFKDIKISKNLIDFEDMMDYTIEVLASNKSIRSQTITEYKYILVDEFQDTSDDNFNLLKLLLPDKDSNLFLVGDDWQSIYGFRGARIEYIIKMKKYFPDVRIYKLKINYRSRKEIVKLSNNFIKKNKFRTRKRLKSFMGRGGVVKGYSTNGLDQEIDIIKNIIDREKSMSGEMAILYRNNWQGKYILNMLNNNGSKKANYSNLMTIHSSKGLEFDSVIIVGVSDDIIPDASTSIEEERRLFYVALTRAKERLHIIHHKSADNTPSLFAKEIGMGEK